MIIPYKKTNTLILKTNNKNSARKISIQQNLKTVILSKNIKKNSNNIFNLLILNKKTNIINNFLNNKKFYANIAQPPSDDGSKDENTELGGINIDLYRGLGHKIDNEFAQQQKRTIKNYVKGK